MTAFPSAFSLELRQALTWLEAQYEPMRAMIERLVNIDGGSYDKQGVDQVADALAEFFSSHGLETEREPVAKHGDFTRTSTSTPQAGKCVLLLGHRDTVFPKGEAARRPYSQQGMTAYGPGVADMKAGLVMHAFVLVALHRFKANRLPIQMVTTGDEEISSPFSRPFIEAAARQAVAVFNAEPGRANGAVVIARKGSVYYRLKIHGKAAHSGVAFTDGASAISALAKKISAIDALTNVKEGVTFNVGLIKGGQSINTTAPYAECEIDMRYVLPEQRAPHIEMVKQIAAAPDWSGTTAEVEIFGEMLPMPQRPSGLELFAKYKAAMQSIGLDSEGVFTGGCSDSGFTSAVGAPTVCAVGPTGGKIHTQEEYLELDTLVPRAKALAIAIASL